MGQEHDILTYNYNEEMHPSWQQNVDRALERRSVLAEVKDKTVLNRRQRKVYDRPRLDTDQTDYVAWREFVNTFEKDKYMGYKVQAQLEISPKWLIHAIG